MGHIRLAACSIALLCLFGCKRTGPFQISQEEYAVEWTENRLHLLISYKLHIACTSYPVMVKVRGRGEFSPPDSASATIQEWEHELREAGTVDHRLEIQGLMNKERCLARLTIEITGGEPKFTYTFEKEWPDLKPGEVRRPK